MVILISNLLFGVPQNLYEKIYFILDRERPVGGSGNNNDGIALRQVHFAASTNSDNSNGGSVMALSLIHI